MITNSFNSKNVSFNKLVAQTCDRPSNINGCYSSLQAIIKKTIDSHVIYVHCYAYSLNLVVIDSVNVEKTNVIKLFDDVGSLYNLFNRSMKVHQLFEDLQEKKNLQKLPVNRLNTVHWSSRVLCLGVFHKRYDDIIEVLKKVVDDMGHKGLLLLVFLHHLFGRKLLRRHTA